MLCRRASLAVSSFARDSTGTKALNESSELSRCYLKNEETATEQERVKWVSPFRDRGEPKRSCSNELLILRSDCVEASNVGLATTSSEPNPFEVTAAAFDAEDTTVGTARDSFLAPG